MGASCAAKCCHHGTAESGDGAAEIASANSEETQCVFEYLSATPFFLHLDEAMLRTLARHFNVSAYPQDAVIVSQGEALSTFYIIGEGMQRCMSCLIFCQNIRYIAEILSSTPSMRCAVMFGASHATSVAPMVHIRDCHVQHCKHQRLSTEWFCSYSMLFAGNHRSTKQYVTETRWMFPFSLLFFLGTPCLLISFVCSVFSFFFPSLL